MVRLVDQDGNMVGEIATEKAREMAEAAGMDLVEVSPDARPPVCKIMDYGKVQYEKQKKQNNSSKPQKVHRQELKQLRLRAKTGQHDIDVKVRQARGFLERRDKVKINVMFKGRENAHHERGREMLDKIIVTLEDIGAVEKGPHMESNKMMSCTLTPKAS